MSNEIHQYFSELLAALRFEEAEQKKIHDNAIDIEDMADATAVTIEARTKIQLLRKNAEELQLIHNEFSSVFANEYKTSSETNESMDTFAEQVNVSAAKKTALIKKLEAAFNELIVLLKQVQRTTDVISDTGGNSQTEDFPTESEIQKFIEVAEAEESSISPLDENEPFDEPAKHEINEMLLNEQEINQMALDESVLPSENDEHFPAHQLEFVLLGKAYYSGWQEFLTELCETMILRRPYKFAGISVAPLHSASEQRVLSLDEQQITEPYTKLSNGLYVTTAGSSNEIKKRCEHILKACGYNSDVLQIS